MSQNLVQEAIKLDLDIDIAILDNQLQQADTLTDKLNIIIANFSELEQIEFDEYLNSLSPEVLYVDYE